MIRNESPVPYMGAKQRIAAEVWAALGNATRYIEPFFGGGSVLLNRPHRGKSEIINDLDGLVANFWRAVQMDPLGVADHIKGPLSELDMHARASHLNAHREPIAEQLRSDPRWYDCEAAAWWAWCQSLFLGGLHQGGHSKPGLGPPDNCARGILHSSRQPVGDYLSRLADRLGGVAVLCGDWSRCVTDSYALPSGSATVGVFLDPPYDQSVTTGSDHYASGAASCAVREWCLKHGDNPQMRIVLCGMGREHAELESYGWRVDSWSKRSTFGGFSTSKSERIWYSPHCLSPAPLFAARGAG